MLTLDDDAGTTGDFTGTNHLDLAVSNTSDPLGTWTIYRLPVQDDGTAGHARPPLPAERGLRAVHRRLPAHRRRRQRLLHHDERVLVLPGPEFNAAQIYAFSKAALASGAARTSR